MKSLKNILLNDHEFVVVDASTFFKRLVGLMGKKELGENEAMLLRPCTSIHTCFMKFPIDVVFLDKMNRVVGTIGNLQPWKMSGNFKNAHQVLEMPVGSIKKTGIKKNLTLYFEI